MNLQIVKRLFKSFKMSYLKSLLAIYILGFSIVGCNCSPKTTLGTKSIIMRVLDPELLADQKTLRIDFELDENIGEVNLEGYRLKITLATGGLGNAKLIYTNDTAGRLEIDSVAEQKLTYFSNHSILSLANAPLELSFELENDTDIKQVIIKFELLNQDGIVVTDATSVWKRSNKPIELKLERLGDGVLKGADNIVELKITNWGTEKTEANQVKLKITRDKGDTATIEGAIAQQDGSYILDFPNTIDGSGAYILKKIEINSGTDPESAFKIKPIYKGEEHDSPLTLIYKQGEIEIRNLPKRFVADNIVSFDLFNNTDANIQVQNYTLELVSDNDATFQFVTEKNSIEGNGPIKIGKAVAKIDEIAFTIPDGKLKGNSIIPKKYKISGIGFTIQNPNGQSKAGVILQLKKGGEIVAVSEKNLWEAAGIQLDLELLELATGNNNLRVKNLGIEVSTNDIYVDFANPEGFNFRLGNAIGANINMSLSEILGATSTIQPNQSVLFQVGLSDDIKNINQYGAKLKLDLKDKNGNLLIEKAWPWTNDPKISIFRQKINEQGGDKCIRLDDEFEKLQPLKQKQSVLFDSEWVEQRINIFRLRDRAVASIDDYKKVKAIYKKLLAEEGNNMPDSLKQEAEYRIKLSDDYLVKRIDTIIEENFSLIKRKVVKFLKKSDLLIKDNKPKDAQKYINKIIKLAKISDKFTNEINTTEAKQFAKEINNYKDQAEDLLKKSL